MVYSCRVQRNWAIQAAMSKTLRSLLVILALTSAVELAAADARQNYSTMQNTILAQDDDRGRGRGRGRNRGDGNEQDRVVPLDVVINSLMSQYPGKPLDARGPMQRGNQLIYEIVWLTQNGRQIVVIVDARTGQVLRVRGLG